MLQRGHILGLDLDPSVLLREGLKGMEHLNDLVLEASNDTYDAMSLLQLPMCNCRLAPSTPRPHTEVRQEQLLESYILHQCSRALPRPNP